VAVPGLLAEGGPPFGMQNWVPTRVPDAVPNPSPIAYAWSEAIRRTRDMVELTVFSILRLFQGRVGVEAIGGPLTIFEYAGTAAREGPVNYLTLMAFVSVNLGILNLLPIPLLDGGHLAFFLFEGVSRRRPSPRVRQVASLVGLVILVALMILAFTNDLGRQWPWLLERIGAT
jgi:regulator of sigma E protease